MKCVADASNQENPVQCKAKHPPPHPLLFLTTPSKQHLGTKERASPSPLHTAAAKDTERSSDTTTSAPPWTSHTLDGVLFTSPLFSLNFKKIWCCIQLARTNPNLCLKSLFIARYGRFRCFLGKVCFGENKEHLNKTIMWWSIRNVQTDLTFGWPFL